MFNRYRAPIPADWPAKSRWALERMGLRDLRAQALTAFGLKQPLKPEDVLPLLKERADVHYASMGGAIRELRHADDVRCLRYTDFTRGTVGWVYFTSAVAELVTLQELKRTLYAAVGWDEATATTFLLTENEPLLPWIEVERLVGGLWPSFRIHIGSPDATAEQVRSAYVQAITEESGTEVSRAPKTEDIELLFHEEELRRRGMTWEQRWCEWEPKAASLTVNKYESWQAYRNKVVSLGNRLPWAKQMLDAASNEPREADRP